MGGQYQYQQARSYHYQQAEEQQNRDKPIMRSALSSTEEDNVGENPPPTPRLRQRTGALPADGPPVSRLRARQTNKKQESVESQAYFNQAQQKVTWQYNAGGDINFTTVQNFKDLNRNLRVIIKDELGQAYNNGVISQKTALKIAHPLTEALGEIAKSQPAREAFQAQLNEARDLVHHALRTNLRAIIKDGLGQAYRNRDISPETALKIARPLAEALKEAAKSQPKDEVIQAHVNQAREVIQQEESQRPPERRRGLGMFIMGVVALVALGVDLSLAAGAGTIAALFTGLSELQDDHSQAKIGLTQGRHG